MTATIAWFTGLPASGKTTLAHAVQRMLGERGVTAVVLDSDHMREILGESSYADASRDAFYRALAGLAGSIAAQDVTVLVAATAPRRMHRDLARATGCPVLEVWVRTPLAICEARDPKGLYAKARRGETTQLPGLGVPYEAPVSPDVTADGGHDHAALLRVVEALASLARPR